MVRTALVLETPEEEAGEKRRAMVQIEDDGAGIEEKELKSIFEPFFTTKSLGTGLGLTNARKVIELHDGTIDVKSAVSVGTTVTINLSYEDAHPASHKPGVATKDSHEVHSSH